MRGTSNSEQYQFFIGQKQAAGQNPRKSSQKLAKAGYIIILNTIIFVRSQPLLNNYV
jgi:hypothetical protein